jgi:hypothetical protein
MYSKIDMLKSISFHPKLAAVIDVLVNAAMLFVFGKLSSWWMVWVWLGIRVAIWALLLWSVYYAKEMSRVKHLISLSAMLAGITLFLLFIEWRFAWYASAALFSFFSFFSFWLLPASDLGLSVFVKPHLRWRFLMSIIGLAGIFQGIQSIILLQILPNIHQLVWLSVSSLCAALFAGWWWWEYNPMVGKKIWLSVALWFVLISELVWVINLLPLGYLTGSLALVWVWYVLWLLFRFNLTPEGVHWRKQIVFLSSNAFLFILFLFFISLWK